MGLKILIVDDSDIIRSVLKRCLQLSGLEIAGITEAGNGAAALEKLDAEPADVMFCDLHMPVMDGISLIRLLAHQDRLRSMPVIIISSDRSSDRMRELTACGVHSFLKKPFTPDSLREAVLPLMGVKS